MPEELGPGLVVEMDSRLGVLQITVYCFDSATVDEEGNVAFSYFNSHMAQTIVKITPPVVMPVHPFVAESDVEVIDRLESYFGDFDVPKAAVANVIGHIRSQMTSKRLVESARWN